MFLPKWVKKNQARLAKQKRPLFGGVADSSLLAVGVLEELLILLVIAVASHANSEKLFYFATVVAYTLHLVGHIGFCFQYRAYVPGIATALIQLPVTLLWIVATYNHLNVHWALLLAVSLGIFVLLVLNVLFLHWLLAAIARKNLL